MSILGIPFPVQRTIDRSTEQPMPNYDPEPVFSSGGAPDELSAAGQRYALGKMSSYAAAHLEADADDLACEVDALRTELASAELSPAEFRALVEAECGTDRRWKVEAWAYVYSSHWPAGTDQSRYHATVYSGPDDERGVPLKADSLRDLARLIIELHGHMERMGVLNVLAVS